MALVCPLPVVLLPLNKALEPFQGSYQGTRITLNAFSEPLDISSGYHTDAELHSEWQQFLDALRVPNCSSVYRDPESLQVAQVVSRASLLDVLGELEVYEHAGCREVCMRGPGSYSEVFCSEYWLAESARLGRASPKNVKELMFLHHLEHCMKAQPEFEYADWSADPGEAAEPWILGPFGHDGALSAAATYVARDAGWQDLRNLIKLFTPVAMDIVDIWDYTAKQGLRQPAEMSFYKCYYLGLIQSRTAFASLVRASTDLFEDLLPFEMRDCLKAVPLVEIWNWLWQRARGICVTIQPLEDMMELEMYTCILKHVGAAPSLSDVQISRTMAVVKDVRDAYFYDMRLSTPVSLRPRGYPVLVEFDRIMEIQTHLMQCHWGRWFYGEDLPAGFSTDLQAVSAYIIAQREEAQDENTRDHVPEDLLRDIYDGAALDVHGQSVNPLDFAQAVDEAHRPRKQNCTICSDIFVPRTARAVCLKLRGCGHYFHDGCIRAWVNSVAPNSNLCPDCRTQICESRRPVRVAGAITSVETAGQAVAAVAATTPVEDDPVAQSNDGDLAPLSAMDNLRTADS